MLDIETKPHKEKLISTAMEICSNKIHSIADLGACWGVNAGYTFYALRTSEIKRAVIVDQNITELTRVRGAEFPQVEYVQGMLGDDESMSSVGHVDALIMYDILLHQVSPDWDEFIEKWAEHTNVFIIYNQMWEKSEHSIRFVDNGLEWYKENVYFTDEALLEKWFEMHDARNKAQNKKFKDVHNYWQWGITQKDLINKILDLGFQLRYFKHYGAWNNLKPWIKNEGYVFLRAS